METAVRVNNVQVKREELFIQAKLWNSNHRPEHVLPDIEKTLADLQLDYLDSFVIHWPQAVPSNKQLTLRPDGCFPAHHTKVGGWAGIFTVPRPTLKVFGNFYNCLLFREKF